MDKHYKNIKVLIENNLVEVKKNEISSNYHTLLTYHNIGKEIVEDQSGEVRAKYGTALIKEYSVLLEKEYGTKYGRSNLMLMRQFYLTFPNVHAVRNTNNLRKTCKISLQTKSFAVFLLVR